MNKSPGSFAIFILLWLLAGGLGSCKSGRATLVPSTSVAVVVQPSPADEAQDQAALLPTTSRPTDAPVALGVAVPHKAKRVPSLVAASWVTLAHTAEATAAPKSTRKKLIGQSSDPAAFQPEKGPKIIIGLLLLLATAAFTFMGTVLLLFNTHILFGLIVLAAAAVSLYFLIRLVVRLVKGE